MVRTRHLAALHAVFIGVLVLVGSSRARSADQPGTLSEVSLPGGLRAALSAVGDQGTPDRAQFLLEFIRRTYDMPFRQRDDARENAVQALVSELNGPVGRAGSAVTLPLPLTPDLWINAVFAGRATPQTLVGAIVQSRNASLFYVGLLSLDDDTRAWLAGQPELISELASRHSIAFLAAAPGLRVSAGGVNVPGGPSAEPIWQALVEKRPNQPAEFVRALMASGQGRLAPFFGAISQLTPQQLRVALNLDSADVPTRVESARRLYAVLQRVLNGRMLEQRAFTRPTLDPAMLVAGLAVDAAGRPSIPGTRGLWTVVFDETDDGRLKPMRDDARVALERNEPADFSWLCEQIFKGSENDQRRRYSMVLFASRRLGRMTPETAQDAIDAIRAAGAYPVLTAALERAQVADLKAIASAARRAAALSAIPEDGRALRALTQFQGAVAVVTRAALRGSLDAPAATRLVLSLSDVSVGPHGDYEGRLVRWLTGWIGDAGSQAPARGPAALAVPTEEIFAGLGATEQAVLGLLSGPEAAQPRVVTWEGMRYRLDLPRAEAIRLSKALGEAPRWYLSSAESFADVADAVAEAGLTRDKLRQLAQALRPFEQDEPIEGGDDAPAALQERYREAVTVLKRAAGDGDVRAAARLAPSLRLVADDLLARGLMELAYAAALGDRDGVSISASEAATRHDFGLRSTLGRPAAWRFPIAGTDVGSRWRVSGAIMGLDVALADFSLVPLSNKPPPRKPTVGDTDRRTFIETVALVVPRSFTDADRDTIVAAMAKGRERLESTRTTADVAALADAAAISAARRALLSWMVVNDPTRVRAFLSPVELLWAGLERARVDGLHAWGSPASSRLACLCLQVIERRPWEIFAGRLNSGMMASAFPDLNLRLAELLSELQMPAPLLAPVLTSATLDFINSAISRDPDDRRGLVDFVQGLTTDRVEQYLALLTTDGPLVPIGEDSAKGDGGRR